MADQFSGVDLVVLFNTVDISETARTVDVAEEAPPPPDIDCSHKGDTAQNLKEGIPGGVVTTVTLTGLDEVGGVAAIKDFARNALDTLTVYPQGLTHTTETLTIQNARFHSFTENIPYDGCVGWTAVWTAKNTVTRGTYDSSA
jgi:hypothetical protein